MGDPFADVKAMAGVLPEGVLREMVREAKEVRDQLCPFSFGCPLSQRFLATELGQAHLFWLMLQEHHPDVTEARAWQLWTLTGAAEAQKIVSSANGSPPNGAAPVAAQAQPPAGVTSVSTGTPSSAG